MEQSKLFQKLAQILGVPEDGMSAAYALADEEWDSLELMSIAAAVDEVYDVVIPVREISGCKTVGDILLLIEEKKAEDE